MTFLQWRRFNFFEKNFLNETNDNFADLAKSCHLTCSSNGNGYLIFGDSLGLINFVSKQHQVASFNAYQVAVTHCCYINVQRSSNYKTNVQSTSSFYFATLGTDSEDLVPVLKIWSIDENSIQHAFNNSSSATTLATNLENINEQTTNNKPFSSCIRSTRICQSTPQLNTLRNRSMVTAVDVCGDTMMAIGFNYGQCVIVKGELTRDKSLQLKVIDITSKDVSITGVAFSSYTRFAKKQSKGFRAFNAGNSSNEITSKQYVNLFVSTPQEICSYNLSDSEKKKTVLDSFGCDVGANCLKYDPKQVESMQFVVGRSDAIYFYNVEDRGPCLAYEGKKLFLYWLRDYLVVVTMNNNSNGNDSQSTKSNNTNSNMMTIYDIKRKFIAYSFSIPAVNQIISEWSLLYIITTDGRVLMFKELDTETKLEILFQKNQFSLAIDLAKTETFSQDTLSDMFKQYGDHLYKSGDYDGAINQYCQTIGDLEPSYVIRKYLDLQRIHNLTTYLQALHKRGLATEDHTTLLINCYVKLKEDLSLNEFLRSSDIVFDVDIAIKVLKQAGYFENAILLAKRHNRYDSYFSILLEDQKDSKAALETLREMLRETKQQDIVCEYLIKYGRLLMSVEPDKTTELLKSLCLILLIKSAEQTNQNEKENKDDKKTELSFNLLELALNKKTKTVYTPASFLHLFLKNPSKFIEYLEFVIAESDSLKKPNGESLEVPFEISDTLLEMYMHTYKNEIIEDGLAGNETKIMNFLKNETSSYDSKKAMILCQMSNFIPGVLFLYEKNKMFKQILAHHISRKDSENVIDTCQKYGGEDSSLWIDALQYFSEIYTENQFKNTSLVLEQIERHQLLPPLMVIEILSKHGKVTLSVVRKYVMRWIKVEQEQTVENEKLIQTYREEWQKIKNQITEINEKPRVFQATKCSACKHLLDIPSIHFMCGHSFHSHCYMNDETEECQICSSENRKLLNEMNAFDNVKNLNELFQKEIVDCSDPFEMIARYTSNGLFNPLSASTDDTTNVQS